MSGASTAESMPPLVLTSDDEDVPPLVLTSEDEDDPHADSGEDDPHAWWPAVIAVAVAKAKGKGTGKDKATVAKAKGKGTGKVKATQPDLQGGNPTSVAKGNPPPERTTTETPAPSQLAPPLCPELNPWAGLVSTELARGSRPAVWMLPLRPAVEEPPASSRPKQPSVPQEENPWPAEWLRPPKNAGGEQPADPTSVAKEKGTDTSKVKATKQKIQGGNPTIGKANGKGQLSLAD